MTRKSSSRTSSRNTKSTSDGPNWVIIGSIVGVGALLLIILIFASNLSGSNEVSTAAIATEGAASSTVEAERQELAATGLLPYCENNPERCFSQGDPNAPVTIFEFSDYGCPHCRNFNLDNLDSIRAEHIDTGNVYWVTVPYGLTQQGGVVQYLPSAAATLCANEQGEAVEFHHELFQIQQSSRANTDGAFMDIAEALGLDTDAFEQCLDSNRYNAVVLANIDLANNIGVRSTPTFVINGDMVPGNDPATIRQRIQANLSG